MILADSSIWMDHFRSLNHHLAGLVSKRILCCHPGVIGEVACGNLANRDLKLNLMKRLHRAPAASDDQVLSFIAVHKLTGRGIGYIDAHLLASAAIDSGLLWTLDRRLHEVAASLGLSY